MATFSGISSFVSVSVSSSFVYTSPSELTPADREILLKLIREEFIKPEIKAQPRDLQEVVCAIALGDSQRVKTLLERNAGLANLSIPGLDKELSLLEFACLYHDKESTTIGVLIQHAHAHLVKDATQFRGILKILIKKPDENQDERGSRIIQMMLKRATFSNISALSQNIIPGGTVTKEGTLVDIVRNSILDLAANGKSFMLTALLNQLTTKPQLEARVHSVFDSIWPADISEIVFSFVDYTEYNKTPLTREMMRSISQKDPSVDGENCHALYFSGLSRAVRSLTLLEKNRLPQSKLIETVRLFLSFGANLTDRAAQVEDKTISIIDFYRSKLPAHILEALSPTAIPVVTTPAPITPVVATSTELVGGERQEDWLNAF